MNHSNPVIPVKFYCNYADLFSFPALARIQRESSWWTNFFTWAMWDSVLDEATTAKPRAVHIRPTSSRQTYEKWSFRSDHWLFFLGGIIMDCYYPGYIGILSYKDSYVFQGHLWFSRCLQISMKSSIWGLQRFREGLSVREGHIPKRRPCGLGYVNTDQDEKTPWNTWLPSQNFLLHRLPDADDEQAGLVFFQQQTFLRWEILKMRWQKLIWTCCFVIILSFTIRYSRFFFASCFPSCQSVQFLVGALVLYLKHFFLQLVVTVISGLGPGVLDIPKGSPKNVLTYAGVARFESQSTTTPQKHQQKPSPSKELTYHPFTKPALSSWWFSFFSFGGICDRLLDSTVVDSKDETHGNITSEQEVDDNELVAGPSKSYVFVDVSSENQRTCEVHPTQCNIMPYHVISCHIISVHIILVPYHTCIASSHMILYDIMSYHIIMIAVISMWMLSFLMCTTVKNARFPTPTTSPINLQASPPLVRNESAKTAGTFGGADPASLDSAGIP